MTVDTTSKASELLTSISILAERLQYDLEEQCPKRELFTDLREIRRSVNALDQELRMGSPDTIGDAC